MNMPLSAFAGDYKVHCSAFKMGPQIESENTMVACMQTSESSWWVLDSNEAQQLSSLSDIFIIAAPLRQLSMCISSDSSLSKMIADKPQQTVAAASEEMFN